MKLTREEVAAKWLMDANMNRFMELYEYDEWAVRMLRELDSVQIRSKRRKGKK